MKGIWNINFLLPNKTSPTYYEFGHFEYQPIMITGWISKSGKKG